MNVLKKRRNSLIHSWKTKSLQRDLIYRPWEVCRCQNLANVGLCAMHQIQWLTFIHQACFDLMVIKASLGWIWLHGIGSTLVKVNMVKVKGQKSTLLKKSTFSKMVTFLWSTLLKSQLFQKVNILTYSKNDPTTHNYEIRNPNLSLLLFLIL